MSRCFCPNGPTIFHNGAAGDSTCMECGVVVSENTLVSEISFGETSGGAAIAHGTLVSEGSTHARGGGLGGRHRGEESSEQVIFNGRVRIAQVATAMGIPDVIREAALRFYKLAVTARFTKGRKSRHVVAACLYAACQHAKFSYMLIDFSDLLQINVFVLGATYLRLIKVLHMPRPYVIDPAHYIQRFAALLEFGEETPKVASDATRLVKRFRADWMNTGRRPAGICGACLLLAARMNNFRRSVQEIVQVVKIADATLIKRLDEFRNTGSSIMTIADFRDDSKWLPEAIEAPPIMKKQEQQEIKSKKRKRDSESPELPHDSISKRKVQVIDTGDANATSSAVTSPSPEDHSSKPINLSRGIFKDVGLGPADVDPVVNQHDGAPPRGKVNKPLFLFNDSDGESDKSDAEDASLFQPATSPEAQDAITIDDPYGLYDDKNDEEIAHEVENALKGQSALQMEVELAASKQQDRSAGAELEDPLDDLDEEELDRVILSEEEVRLKTRVWVELNKDYLEKIAAKGLEEEEGRSVVRKTRVKKPKSKPRDSTTAQGATPAEAVGHLLKKKKFSRKINYEAVKSLFKNPSSTPLTLEEEDKDDDEKVDDDHGLIQMDDVIDEGAVDDGQFFRRDDIHEFTHADDKFYGEDDYYDESGYQEEI
ncbi:transcription factor TFIIIB subunit brf1 [Tulasnella sp. 419]|nr:transcription factor TFIIIB subunit brf1 [Tulasnella sp. 418]KAG8960195.1 transcription factor TFIIIB subunit brf1 [Tulasnella sp. 419]